jgi:methyl-accepting chemotaxis protein
MKLPRPRLASLRVKMLALLVPLTVAVLGAITWIAISSSSSAQKDAVYGHMSELAAHQAKAFESELRVARETGKDVAALASPAAGRDRAALLGQVESVLRRKPEIFGMGISWNAGVFASDAAHRGEPTAGPHGELLARFTRPDGPDGPLKLGRLDVEGGVAHPTKESMFVGNVGGMTLTAFLNPIVHDGKAIGLVGTDVPLTSLQQATQRMKVLDSGYAMLVSNSGLVISSPATEENGKLTLAALAKRTGETGYTRLAAAIRSGREGHLQITDAGGKDLTLFYAPLQTAEPWSLVVAAPTGEVLASAHSLRTKLLVAGLLGVLLIGVATAFIASRLTKPIGGFVRGLRSLGEQDVPSLRDGLQAMSRGDLTVAATPVTEPVEVQGSDEIALASRTLNELVDATHASIRAYDGTRRQLGEMIGGVARRASEVSSASQRMAVTSDEAGRAVGEIAHAVAEVAQGTERQVKMVASTQERARGVGEAVAGAAHQALQTTEAATRAREVADGGVEAVREASEAMQAVRESSLQTTQAIESLGTKSEQIGGIVETITASPRRPTCWRSTRPSRPPAPVSRAAASRSSPTRCASWPRSPSTPPSRSPG